MENAFLKRLYAEWYVQDLEYLKKSLQRLKTFQREETKKIYKTFVEIQIKQLKTLKDKIKNL